MYNFENFFIWQIVDQTGKASQPNPSYGESFTALDPGKFKFSDLYPCHLGDVLWAIKKNRSCFVLWRYCCLWLSPNLIVLHASDHFGQLTGLIEFPAEQLIGELTLSGKLCPVAGDCYKSPGMKYTLALHLMGVASVSGSFCIPLGAAPRHLYKLI